MIVQTAVAGLGWGGQADAMSELPVPTVGDEAGWVREHLGALLVDDVRSSSIRGGQAAADAALAAFDVAGYAEQRNEVWPVVARGASRLSPYIRHGLLTLPRVWRDVRGPSADVAKFRDELLWQEYARHLYSRVGSVMGRSLRFSVLERGAPALDRDGWPDDMACVASVVGELRDDGWLPNQARMWLASQWSVRGGRGWRDGEDLMFSQLLDGSRAANRVGWQWTVGALTGKPYGFSRQQVERRAPGVCGTCALESQCPIQRWPDDREPEPRPTVDPRLRRGTVEPTFAQGGIPGQVWLTAESLGDDDPALRAYPDVPAVFVWDAPLLARLRLSSVRLVFLAECLADLATRRGLEVRVGEPTAELAGRRLAATDAPVPGWRRRAEAVGPVAVEAWPWLVPPHSGPVASFTAWRRSAGV